MLASFTPTPLYPKYREQWDLDSVAVSLAFAAYPVGVILVLVLFGGLSDRWGRTPTLRTGAFCLAAAMATLAVAPTIEVLVLGRAMQGAATALVTSAGAATLMELHPRGPHAGSHRNTLALSVGIALGPVLAAQAVTRLPHPLAAPYLVVALLLLPSAWGLLAPGPSFAPLTGARFLRPVRVPAPLRRSFALAAFAIIGTNASFALLGSFGPDLMAAVGHPGPVAAGVFVTTVLLVITSVQVLARRVPLVLAMLAGTCLMSLGWGTVALGTDRGAVAPVWAGGLVVGVGAGLGLLASATHIGVIAPVDRRAEIYAVYLLAAFAALAIAALALGHVVEDRAIWSGAGAVALVNLLATGALLVLRRPGKASV
jgi:MFS family permease